MVRSRWRAAISCEEPLKKEPGEPRATFEEAVARLALLEACELFEEVVRLEVLVVVFWVDPGLALLLDEDFPGGQAFAFLELRERLVRVHELHAALAEAVRAPQRLRDDRFVLVSGAYFDGVQRAGRVDHDAPDFDELQGAHEQRELHRVERHAVFGGPGPPAQRELSDGAVSGAGHVHEHLVEVELAVVLAGRVRVLQRGDQLACVSAAYLRG